MTLDDVDKQIRPQLPTVTLTAGTFGNDVFLSPLLQQYFFDDVAGQGQVTIVKARSYVYDTAQGTIAFSGDGEGGPFNGMPLTQVTITMADGSPRLTIEAQAADGFTLPQAFPDLKSPIIQALAFSQVTLTWASWGDANSTLGFYFAGNIDFNVPPFVLLKMFLSGIEAPRLWGVITMQGTTKDDIVQYVPKTTLVFDETADSVSVGPLSLSGPDIRLFVNPYFNTFTNTWETETFVRIITTLRFKTNELMLSADIHDANAPLVLEAQIDEPFAAGLDELSAFVNTTLSIPDFKLKVPEGLQLQDVKIAVNPAGPQVLQLIAVNIGTDPSEKWPLWGNVFLEGISIAFHLTPGTTGGYVVGGEIAGNISGWLGLRAGFASDGHYTFSGALLQPLQIKDAYAFFTGTTLDDLPDLDVTLLDLTVDRPSGGAGIGYVAELSVEGQWTIVTTPIEVVLDGLLFRVSHDAGAGTDATLSATLGISDYSVALGAAYDSTDGWTFDGSVDAGQPPASLAELVARIDSTFHIVTTTAPAIPPFLTAWTLKSLAATVAKQQGNFDFVASVGNAALPTLTLDFGVHLDHGTTSFTKTFKGDAVIVEPTFDATLALTFVQQTSTTPPLSTQTISGVYSSTKPPTLTDLLTWVSNVAKVDAALPAELQLDAEANGFGIQIVQQDQQPPSVEVAGELSLQVEGSDWTLYFAYTNDTSYTQGGTRVLVDGQPAYVLGVALGGLVDLSKLPLVGKIPGVDKLRIDKLGFFYTNAQIGGANPTLYFQVPAVSGPNQLAPDPTAAFLEQPGFTLMAVFGNQNDASNASGTGVKPAGTMPLPVGTGPSGQSPGTFNTQAAAPKDPIRWLDLNKTLGPVSLQKVGLGYEKPDNPKTQLGKVSVYLDGAFQIAGFGMALDRLGISVDVPNPKGGVSFNPSDIGFHLGGLFVSFKSEAFTIAGGFITLPGEGVNFIGEFTLQAGEYGLQAYGGFSNQQAAPSLFLFVHVEAPIGGPPFFFVNGLSGGFGINRGFRLPTFDQLTNYPFLPASSTIPKPSQIGGDPQSQLATMMQALTSLAQYVPVEPGEYWLAVGLDVSSFEMISVSAVLSVAFGVKFQVGLVGSASMTLPVDEPEPVAFLQIDFEVVFSPADGLVAAFGKIPPASFIYGGMVHLSGGFAFSTWFSGPNTGNYVVTVGGYHPRYNKPAIYPSVPRLQAVFGINSLSVTGDAYFALVPHALMAGLQIHATWSLGSIDAWFDARMDFLLNWKPFHYEADAFVQIGVSATIHVLFVKVRITVHAGVTLEIWGPPFGGRAVVDLDVISFTIRFGDAQVQEPVGWKEFSAFLPSVNADQKKPAFAARPSVTSDAAPRDDGNKPLVNVSVGQGLLKAFKPGESPDAIDWLIDPNAFTLITQSAAPCTDATFNDGPGLATWTADRYVDPSNLRDSVEAAAKRGEESPFFAYDVPASGPSWNALTFGIVPMGLQNVQSTHCVHLRSLDQGQLGAAVTDVIVILQTSSVSQALWGNAGVSAASLSGGQELIDGALTGFAIVPTVWLPSRTTFIPYFDLVFDTNDLFLEQDALPAINTAPFADADTIVADMDSGALFGATAGVRVGIVDLLRQNGFPELSLAGDAGFSTGQYQADPLLGYMSDTNETDLAA